MSTVGTLEEVIRDFHNAVSDEIFWLTMAGLLVAPLWIVCKAGHVLVRLTSEDASDVVPWPAWARWLGFLVLLAIVSWVLSVILWFWVEPFIDK